MDPYVSTWLFTFAAVGAILLAGYLLQELAEHKGAGWRWLAVILAGMLLLAIAAAFSPAPARDDGRHAASPLKSWFDSLSSGRGPCCSDADGFAVSDPDWQSRDGHYRVRIDGEWIDVPDDAVITEPNRAGRTMVWPLRGSDGLSIRCFMPGAMT